MGCSKLDGFSGLEYERGIALAAVAEGAAPGFGFTHDRGGHKERVVRAADLPGLFAFDLNGKRPAQQFQHRFDEFVFGLGFVPGGGLALGLLPEGQERRVKRRGVGLPSGQMGQAFSQKMAGKEGFVHRLRLTPVGEGRLASSV